MNPDAALADRRQCVREAGREWLQAKWIDENAFRRIQELFPDDRVRAGPAFRSLFFILTFSAVMGALVAGYSLSDSVLSIGTKAAFAGLICWFIANYLIGPKKRRQGGIEAAFSLASVLNLAFGLAMILSRHAWPQEESRIILILSMVAILCFVAAWVWGYWPFAALSAALLFLAILSIVDSRFFCLVVAGALHHFLLKRIDSAALPPSHRKCALAFLAVSILAVYAATNVYLLDQNAFSGILFSRHRPESFPRWLAISLTAVFPVLIWLTGILQRRRLFLILGFGLSALSLVTLRMYVHVAPLWLAITGSGVALLAAASILRRLLDSSADGERAGFTAAPLTHSPEKQQSLQIIASIAAMTPNAASSTGNTQFQGEGGKFGGGGASGQF